MCTFSFLLRQNLLFNNFYIFRIWNHINLLYCYWSTENHSLNLHFMQNLITWVLYIWKMFSCRSYKCWDTSLSAFKKITFILITMIIWMSFKVFKIINNNFPKSLTSKSLNFISCNKYWHLIFKWGCSLISWEVVYQSKP